MSQMKAYIPKLRNSVQINEALFNVLFKIWINYNCVTRRNSMSVLEVYAKRSIHSHGVLYKILLVLFNSSIALH